ncbi:MAG: PQQ-binding-like beta-propeller repeat protein [Phycisphaeraceae bacterium]
MACIAVTLSAIATETEHQGFTLPKGPGSVKIDAAASDWDLTQGVFACSDVEAFRDQYSLWYYGMWDQENLYILARWIDATPLNNPGSTAGDAGFKGDCLQFRTIAGQGEGERVAHFTCWRGSNGKDLVEITYGRDFKGGSVRDAAKSGAQQAFAVTEDGKGYFQEIAIPWKLITTDGKPPIPGAGAARETGGLRMTVEANFTAPSGRHSVKDLFMPGVQPDRIFTFRAYPVWSPVQLTDQRTDEPRPVRLSDGRTFPVRIEDGWSKVDWTGLSRPGADEPIGFKAITYTTPGEGYVSMVIRDEQGSVVRQLLTQAPAKAGEQRVMWDGLGTGTPGTVNKPGDPVAPGKYTWDAIHLPGAGVALVLRGWACTGADGPWDGHSSKGGWGGDHGEACTVDADELGVYLGWSGAEAGKAVVAVDHDGNVRWRQTHGGMGGADSLAVLDGIVYIIDHGNVLYRLDHATGVYSPWQGRPTADMDIIKPMTVGEVAPKAATVVAAAPAPGSAGKVFLAYPDINTVAVLDAATGAVQQRWPIDSPVDMKAWRGNLYVLTGKGAVLRIDAATGQSHTIIEQVADGRALALADDGTIYVGVRGQDQQVKVFQKVRGAKDEVGSEKLHTSDFVLRTSIGRKGGRAALGPWTPDGIHQVNGLGLDRQGRLWVMEGGKTPPRVSLWDVKEGKLLREFFGPTHYGASGGAVCPTDPAIVVGEGCEWRIDPATGKARITGIFERALAGSARFSIANGGRVYLTTFRHRKADGGGSDFAVFERLGEGSYIRRAHYDAKQLRLWSDLNGDSQEQPQEVQTAPAYLTFNGYYCWSHGMADDMSVFGQIKAPKGVGDIVLPILGFSEAGAPIWDVTAIVNLPVPADSGFPYPSHDGKLILVMGGKAFGERWACVEADTGRVRWTYPNPFQGVHGSHRAPPAAPGLIRGAFGVIGAGRLPQPLGRYWVINTNKGEWHILSEHGYYLTSLFQGDLLKVHWPENPGNGTRINDVPPGSGEEDFGGAATQTPDGRIFLQTGKASLWNVELQGMDQFQAIGSGALEISAADVQEARRYQAMQQQAGRTPPRVTITRGTPTFSGDIETDFKDSAALSFGSSAPVTVRLAWDDQNLYLGYRVKDASPWVNGADAPQYGYARGDTVDLQLQTDPAAPAGRAAAAMGDLRLSIGQFAGKPVAVIYREVADEPKPMTFSSGVVKDFQVARVDVLTDLPTKVVTDKDGWTLEAAVPLAALGLKGGQTLKLRGDFGVTLGNAAGVRTALRSYWSNQNTGLVSDEVFELKLTPAAWGEVNFQP